MGFTYRLFGIEIERQVDRSRLSWPEPGEAAREEVFGFRVGNREYCDLHGIDWELAVDIADFERQCIENIQDAPGSGETGSSTISDAAEEHLDLDLAQIMSEFGGFATLDVGVASTVAALSASGHIPFASCNAGAFGGWHPEDFPQVVFCAYPGSVCLLKECAEHASVGLQNASVAYSPVMVFADDVRKFSVFADAIFERRARFAELQA